ncbi:MAG TPA: hypothetical protein VIY54_12090 [Steroidobacteraceae bacterium]
MSPHHATQEAKRPGSASGRNQHSRMQAPTWARSRDALRDGNPQEGAPASSFTNPFAQDPHPAAVWSVRHFGVVGLLVCAVCTGLARQLGRTRH